MKSRATVFYLALRTRGGRLHTTNLSRDNLLVNLDGLVGEERRVAGSHFIHQNTKCPPIHCFVVALRGRISYTYIT